MPATEEQIAQFSEFVQFFERSKIIPFIEGANGDVDLAVSNFLDNPTLYDGNVPGQNWDEQAFHSERDGTAVIQGLPSFQIDGGEDNGIGASASNAPTRPPSRRSNYSAQSRQENGTISGTGQEQVSGPYFGPATRDATVYQNGSWALVPSTNTARAYENPQDPADRARNVENNEPVCFKPARETDPLPSLVAIFGQIPGAWKALLCDGLALDNFGGNASWWDGESAQQGVARLVDGSEDQRDVVAETQRLMAFIRGSHRSYGSTESLSHLPGLSSHAIEQHIKEVDISSADVRFMVGWMIAAQSYNHNDTGRLFRTIAIRKEAESGDVPTETDSAMWQIDITSIISEPKQTLYEAIDDLVWNDSISGSFLRETAHVLVMRVRNQDTTTNAKGLGVFIPQRLYADRWLEGNVETMREVRARSHKLKSQVQAIDQKKRKKERMPDTTDKSQTIDRAAFFAKMIEYMRKRQQLADEDALATAPNIEGSGMDDVLGDGADRHISGTTPGTMEGVQSSIAPQWTAMADAVEKAHEKLLTSLKELDEQRADLIERMENYSSILTKDTPVHLDGLRPTSPTHLYSLRGVAIGPTYETTFIYVDPPTRVPSSTEAVTDDMSTDGQWWKFSFGPQCEWGKPIKEVVPEETVLTETSDAAKEAVLVYASSDACDPIDATLPPALQRFVDADNAAFQAEIVAHEQSSREDGWQGPQAQDELPSYDEAARVDHVEFAQPKQKGNGFVPDHLGALVSDQEYAYNAQHHLNNHNSMNANSFSEGPGNGGYGGGGGSGNGPHLRGG